MCQILKIFILIGAVNVGSATIKRLEYTVNPDWLNVSMTLKTDETKGTNVVDAEAQFLRELPSKVFFDLAVLTDHGNGTYTPTAWKIKLDTCVYMIKNMGNPLFQFYYSNIKKFGRIPLGCPIKPGCYFLKNFEVFPLPGILFKMSDKLPTRLKFEHVLSNRTRVLLATIMLHIEEIDIKRMEYTANPNWVNVSMALKTDESKGTNVLDVDVKFLRLLPSKLLLDLAVMKDYGNGTYVPTFMNIKLDTCVYMTKTGNPFFQFYYSNLKKYGRVPMACPIKVGCYFLKNMRVFPLPGIPFKVSVKYLVKMKFDHILANRNKISLANVRGYLEVVK